MGNYSPKRLLQQEPAALTAVVNLWIAFCVAAGFVSWAATTIVAFLAALNATLLLLYVRQGVVSKSGLNELKESLDES